MAKVIAVFICNITTDRWQLNLFKQSTCFCESILAGTMMCSMTAKTYKCLKIFKIQNKNKTWVLQLSVSWQSSFGFLLCVLKECSNTMEECMASASASMWTTTALKMETVHSSETSEHSSTIWRKIPQEDHQLMKNRSLFQYVICDSMLQLVNITNFL